MSAMPGERCSREMAKTGLRAVCLGNKRQLTAFFNPKTGVHVHEDQILEMVEKGNEA